MLFEKRRRRNWWRRKTIESKSSETISRNSPNWLSRGRPVDRLALNTESRNRNKSPFILEDAQRVLLWSEMQKWQRRRSWYLAPCFFSFDIIRRNMENENENQREKNKSFWKEKRENNYRRNPAPESLVPTRKSYITSPSPPSQPQSHKYVFCHHSSGIWFFINLENCFKLIPLSLSLIHLFLWNCIIESLRDQRNWWK